MNGDFSFLSFNFQKIFGLAPSWINFNSFLTFRTVFFMQLVWASKGMRAVFAFHNPRITTTLVIIHRGDRYSIVRRWFWRHRVETWGWRAWKFNWWCGISLVEYLHIWSWGNWCCRCCINAWHFRTRGCNYFLFYLQSKKQMKMPSQIRHDGIILLLL